MALIFTFLLVASLEMAFAHNNPEVKEETEESAEDLDMCVGCDKEEEKKKEEKKEDLEVEIRIDPATGKVMYVVKGLVIEQ